MTTTTAGMLTSGLDEETISILL